MELVIAKLLKKSEGPSNLFYPNSVWNNKGGKQFGAAFTSKGDTDELDSFFELDFHNKPNHKKEYSSQTFLNFEIDTPYKGKVNWTKTQTSDPHIHFKGYWDNKKIQENFYPKKTIMIVRKVSSNHFDTYFINDNDPFFKIILEKIKMKNSNKAISQRDSGFVFLNINFSNFQISQSNVTKHKTQSSIVQKQHRRSSDPKRRKATELYAEEFVKNYLDKRGYKFIKKFGMPYDLKFSKDDQDIRVEVKGSTLSNVSVVDVTENEILHSSNSLNSPTHAKHDKNTKVFVALVENIKINQKYKASQGELVHFDHFKTLEISSWREFSHNFFSNSNVKLDNNCKFKLSLDRKIIVS